MSHETATFTSPWNLTSLDRPAASPEWAGLRPTSSQSADSHTMTPDRIGFDQVYDDRSLFEVLLDIALTPIRIITSRTAIRTYVRSILLTFATLSLLALSAVAYAAFYYKYIPALGLSVPIHLQFDPEIGSTFVSDAKDTLPTHPHGSAQLPPATLVSDQPYDAVVYICLPRTPENVDAGNFMIDVSLLGPWTSSPPTSSFQPLASDGQDKVASVLARSSRSAILPYANPLSAAMTQLLYRTPRSLVGLNRGEQECLTVPMFERTAFASGKGNVPRTVTVGVRSSLGSRLRVYSVRVEVQAVFVGLRWFMKRWRVTAAIIGTGVFFGVSAAACLITWALITFVLSSRSSGSKDAKTNAIASGKRDDDSALSTSDNQASTPHIKSEHEQDPVLEGAIRGADADDEDEEDEERDDYVLDEAMQEAWAARERDSGIGTSMESSAAGDSGMRGVRRRSVKREDA